MDVSQKVAIQACLQPSTALINKISAATKECLGGDDKFDWADFSTFNEEKSKTGNIPTCLAFFASKTNTLDLR